MRFKELFKLNFLVFRLKMLVPKKDWGIVKEFLNMAVEYHDRQYRLGGEPQIFHVLRVGIRAAQYAKKNPGNDFVVPVALLHDTVEETILTPAKIERDFGGFFKNCVVALSHIEEEEPDEVYLARVAAAGRTAILVKRFDRLDNIESLADAPVEFRQRKLIEIRNALPIWREIDPDGAQGIEKELDKYGAQKTG